MSDNKTVTFRLNEKLLDDLKKIAKAERRTVSSLIEILILKGLKSK
jgi:hypothetical protein